MSIIEKSHNYWKKLIKNEIYFKTSNDSSDFKLLNTQCLESNSENIKNNQEAEALIENLKSLIINRPFESMAEQPPIDRIEKVIYLNKKDISNKIELFKNQKVDGKENIDDTMIRTQKLGDFMVKNIWIMSGTFSLITLGILVSLKKLKN